MMIPDTDVICSKLGSQKESILRFIAEKSDKLGLNAYLVGGAVRDLVLGLNSDDLDVVVEGDAYILVDALSECWGNANGNIVAGKPIKFKKFGTAKLPIKMVGLSDLSNLDFASARRETYPNSGAQPIVVFGDIYDDLARRDFTINALAMVLNRVNFGKIIDNADGIGHLSQKVLSILHLKSFEDDPARLIRAVRYLVRLDFALEQATQTAFDQAVQDNYLRRLPRFRLFDEFKKLLSEPLWQSMVKKMIEYGLLTQVSLCFGKLSTAVFPRLDSDWSDRLGWMYENVDYSESYEDLRSFGLSPRMISRIIKK